MSDKPIRSRDANQLAHMFVGITTGEVDDRLSVKTPKVNARVA